jgi:hypothetical protein
MHRWYVFVLCVSDEKKPFFNIAASSAGFGGGLRQLFHMEVRDRESGELLQNQTSEDPNFTIK